MEKLIEELDQTTADSRARQRLGAADPQSHRHARDRHQELRSASRSRARIPSSSIGWRRKSSKRCGSVPGVTSALAERLTGGRYIEVNIDRDAAARYGLNIEDVQSVITAAIGGETIGETVEGLQRFPISVRYPRELRDSIADLRQLPIVTQSGAQITLGTVAELSITSGPPMLRSENARLSGWVYVDLRGRDLQSAVEDMQASGGPRASVCPRAIRSPGPASSSIWSARRRSCESSCRSRCW